LIKIIIDDPLPRPSSVINSANHIDSKEPVVNDKIILIARSIFQLKITGFTKKTAIPVLRTKAQTKVKYLV